MRDNHFETCTIKVSLSLWDKHTIMPPMRIAACFDGQIIIHDHIPTNTLRALSPLPHYHQSIHLHILFIIQFLPA